jgi:hypothetical protein
MPKSKFWFSNFSSSDSSSDNSCRDNSSHGNSETNRKCTIPCRHGNNCRECKKDRDARALERERLVLARRDAQERERELERQELEQEQYHNRVWLQEQERRERAERERIAIVEKRMSNERQKLRAVVAAHNADLIRGMHDEQRHPIGVPAEKDVRASKHTQERGGHCHTCRKNKKCTHHPADIRPTTKTDTPNKLKRVSYGRQRSIHKKYAGKPGKQGKQYQGDATFVSPVSCAFVVKYRKIERAKRDRAKFANRKKLADAKEAAIQSLMTRHDAIRTAIVTEKARLKPDEDGWSTTIDRNHLVGLKRTSRNLKWQIRQLV